MIQVFIHHIPKCKAEVSVQQATSMLFLDWILYDDTHYIKIQETLQFSVIWLHGWWKLSRNLKIILHFQAQLFKIAKLFLPFIIFPFHTALIAVSSIHSI